MDDRVSQSLKFLGAEEKRGFLWNLMGPNFCQSRYEYSRSPARCIRIPPQLQEIPRLFKHDLILPAVFQHKPHCDPTTPQSVHGRIGQLNAYASTSRFISRSTKVQQVSFEYFTSRGCYSCRGQGSKLGTV